jgi:hypothetical protein
MQNSNSNLTNFQQKFYQIAIAIENSYLDSDIKNNGIL